VPLFTTDLYPLRNIDWPGARSEQETKIQDGSSQLFLFDQSEKQQQLASLMRLSLISTMEKLQDDILKISGAPSLLGLPIRTHLKKKSGA
jgi:hypothetical protein